MTTNEPPASGGVREACLPKLLTWLSPAFPVGSFAYSHGLEWAVAAGDVRDSATLADWIEDVLRHGSGRTDLILLRHAHRATTRAELEAIAELAEAAQPCRERRVETKGQGAAFVLAAEVWGMKLAEGPLSYSVAFGAIARAHGIPEDPAALGFLHAFTANLISAAVRLVPLGQTAGLRVLAALEPTILAVAGETATAGLEDIGSACFRSDIAAMRHETQYTRLFRT
ncbi:MAG: urease accessory protein UreF [Acetobacteraceae bacterium]|nr:urease accessory protein UreF [Acetobacteraceae bacterium]